MDWQTGLRRFHCEGSTLPYQLRNCFVQVLLASDVQHCVVIVLGVLEIDREARLFDQLGTLVVIALLSKLVRLKQHLLWVFGLSF